MRVATIDIGTNSVLLLIAERSASGEVVATVDRATITRLGEGVDARRELSVTAVARTNGCLAAYADEVRAQGVARVEVVGTSAMRDARGGEAVRAHVRELFGVDARVISGDEEARLTFAGALSGLGLPTGRAVGADGEAPGVVVFDIGGGSTEIVHGRAGASGGARIDYARSFDIGSVRLTERHVKSDPPTSGELAAVRADVRRAMDALPELRGYRERAETPPEPVGIAGTVTTLAAVALRLASYDGARVHGHRMTRDELEAVVEELARTPLAARRGLLGMQPKRADVIVAGGVLALEVLDALGADRLRVSDRGVRWGLAEALLDDAR